MKELKEKGREGRTLLEVKTFGMNNYTTLGNQFMPTPLLFISDNNKQTKKKEAKKGKGIRERERGGEEKEKKSIY